MSKKTLSLIIIVAVIAIASGAIIVGGNFKYQILSLQRTVFGYHTNVCPETTPLATSSTTTIIMTYPLGGEEYHPGDEVTFCWHTTNLPSDAGILLSLSNGANLKITDASAGSFTWTVPIPSDSRLLCSGFSDAIMSCFEDSFAYPLFINAKVFTPRIACHGFFCTDRPYANTIATTSSPFFSISK